MGSLYANTELALINTTSNAGTINLPLASSIPGRVINFKDSIGKFGTNTLTLTTNASDTFEDGSTSKILKESNGIIQIIASGNKWYVLTGTQQNTINTSSLNAQNINVLSISSSSAFISSFNLLNNLNSTFSIVNKSTLLYYNNLIIAGTRVAPSIRLTNFISGYINPQAFSGLNLWLDASDINTLYTDNGITNVTTSGQSIYLWKDKSSFKNNAIQSGASSNRPTFSTDATTNLLTLAFDGTQSQGMNLTPTLLPTGTADSTIFIIARAFQPVIQRYICNIFSWGTSGEIGTGVTGQYRLFTSDTIIGWQYFVVWAQKIGVGINVLNTALLFGSVESSTQYFSVNGALSLNSTYLYPSGIFNTGTNFASIGIPNVSGGGTGYLTGSISEIIVYNRPLVTIERQQIEGYLAWKWGIQSNLPTAHPYKNNPP